MAEQRIQARIDFLKKNRPNDPEIKKLQAKLPAGGAPAPQPAPPLEKSAQDYASDIAASSGISEKFDPTLTDRPLQGDLNQARLDQQQQLEQYLGRDIDSAYGQAKQNFEQEMFNKGIPAGSPQWNDRMKALDDNFSRQRADIRAQALQFGGQEMERTFGMGETRRTNQLAEQTGINNTNLGNVGAMTDIDLAYKNLALNKKTAAQQNKLAQQQLAQNRPSGGGGGGGTATATSPFVG